MYRVREVADIEPRQLEAQVERQIRPVVETAGLEFVDVQVAAEPAGAVLRVLLDRPGGIDLEALTEASRVIEPVLDSEPPMSGRYRLEVSSPGIERPLRRLADFERFLGRRVRVHTVKKIDGRRNFKGTIESVKENCVRVKVDETTYAIPIDAVSKANLIVEV